MDAKAECNYDVFISYAAADSTWVEGYLLDALAGAGVRCHLEATFALGAPRLMEFERAIQESRRTLLVLSPAYLTGETNQFIDLLAQSYSLERSTWQVIPLKLEQVELPTRLGMLTYLDATDSQQWQEVIARLCSEVQRPLPEPSPRPTCPYPGLAPFTADTAHFFYGRETEIDTMLQRLRHHRFLLVIGPSGSGKSSLILAGLLPGLRTGRYFSAENRFVRYMRPGNQPLRTLSQTIDAALEQAPGQHLLLVIDQLEEIFTQNDLDPEQSAFIAWLQDLRSLERVTIILGLRADFYDRLMLCALWPITPGERLDIAPPSGAALRDAIVKPAALQGVYLHERLIERLLADAAIEPGVLPLVQETMVLLWGKMTRRLISFDAYKQLCGDGQNGLAVAMETAADATLDKLSSQQQKIARRIFLRLVHFTQGRDVPRRQQSVEDLRAVGDDPVMFDQTLRHLIDSRLLTASGEAGGEIQKIDLAHEALIKAWPTFQGWLRERGDAERTRRRLEEKAKEWERLQKEGGLLDDVALREAENWLESSDAAELGYNKSLPALAQASHAAIAQAMREKEQARQRELQDAQKLAKTEHMARLRQLYFTIGLAILFLVAAVTSWFYLGKSTDLTIESNLRATAEAEALAKADEAIKESNARATAEADALAKRDDAEQAGKVAFSRELAASAMSQLPVDPELGMLLAMEAATISPTVQAKDALRQLLVASRVRTVLRDHTSSVSSAVYSPDGRFIVTASADHTAKLWNASTGQIAFDLSGHTESLMKVVYSDNGEFIATIGACDYYHRFCDTSPRIWSADNGQMVFELYGHTDGVYDIAFSHNSKYVATASRDSTVRIWDLQTGVSISILHGHTDWVSGVAFSPNDERIVTTSRQLLIGTLNIVSSSGADNIARVWDVAKGKLLFELVGHTGPLNSAFFSPDGKSILTASADKTARLWDAESGKLRDELTGHTGEVWRAVFSPDGKYVATMSGRPDNTSRLWDASTGQLITILNGHTDFVWSADFSPDSQLLITASYDGNAFVWEVPSGRVVTILRGHTAWINDVRFSPDGQFVVTASDDGTARLWEVVKAKTVSDLYGYTVALDPTNDRAVSSSYDNSALVWNTQTDKVELTLKGEGAVWDAAFSPDGALVVTGSSDRKARMWDAKTGNLLAVFDGKEYYDTFSTAFSPDSKSIVIADSVAVSVWEVDTKSLRFSVEGQEGFANDAQFSPDGNLLVTASPDGTARLLDAQTGKLISGELQANAGPLYSAAFSPDGKLVATVGLDPLVRVWDVQTYELVAVLSGHSQAVTDVVFSSDGALIITASQDGTICVWEAGTWQNLIKLRGYKGSPRRITYRPESHIIMAANMDGTLQLYTCEVCGTTDDLLRSARQRATRQLTCQERHTYLHTAEDCLTSTAIMKSSAT